MSDRYRYRYRFFVLFLIFMKRFDTDTDSNRLCQNQKFHSGSQLQSSIKIFC